jgi:exodeoxyribonuclease V alpha subunit
VEILCPFRTEGEVSSTNLNQAIREEVNPPSLDKPEAGFGNSVFRLHDRVMQTKNNYNVRLYDKDHIQVGKGIFNGDIGTVCAVYPDRITIDFDGRFMDCPLEMLSDLELAYAMTIHKAMGSEFEVIVIPLLMANRILLTRNLIYTAITRAKQRVILVGEKRALYMAIHKSGKGKRNTLFGQRIELYYKALTHGGSQGCAPEREELKHAG